jgi:hypothetical protein
VLSGGEPWRFVGEDIDLLRGFAELLAEVLPEAAQAIVDGDEDAFHEAAGMVAYASARLGLDRMEGTASALLTPSEAQRFADLADLLRQAERFGGLIGADCGVAAVCAMLRGPLRKALAQRIDEALAASPEQRTRLAHGCAALYRALSLAGGLDRLIDDIADAPPWADDAARHDRLLQSALAAIKRALGLAPAPAAEADDALAELSNAVRVPFATDDESEAHLRRLGLDTTLLSPGPPPRRARLSSLLDGSGATIKMATIELPDADVMVRLAQLDPLLGQTSTRQVGRLAAAELQRQRVLFGVEAKVPWHVAMDQRAGRHHLGVEQCVPGQQAVEVPAMAVGPVHHGRHGQAHGLDGQGVPSQIGLQASVFGVLVGCHSISICAVCWLWCYFECHKSGVYHRPGPLGHEHEKQARRRKGSAHVSRYGKR